jgi:hypothetical protein
MYNFAHHYRSMGFLTWKQASDCRMFGVVGVK